MGGSLSAEAPSSSLPVCLVVTAEIKEDRVAEFLKVIEADAVGSRAEPGCLRFDVLRSQENSLVFTFYEVYKDQAAADQHRLEPHFLLWNEFKESGGVASLSVAKCDGLFLP